MDPSETGSFLDHPEMARAVGRVAIESALFDELLREVLSDVLVPGAGSWILFEGQSSEGLGACS